MIDLPIWNRPLPSQLVQSDYTLAQWACLHPNSLSHAQAPTGFFFAYLLKTNICALYTRSRSLVGGGKGQAGWESKGSLRGQGGSSGPSPGQQAQLPHSCNSTRAEATTFMASHG